MNDSDSQQNEPASNTPSSPKPLRLWPGFAIVALMLLLRFVVPLAVPEAMPVGVLGVLAGGLLFVLWWLLFSRAPWSERLSGLAFMVLGFVLTMQLVDPSIATGMMGILLLVYAIPTLTVAFVGWAVVARRTRGLMRLSSMAIAVALGCGVWTLVKTGGFTSDLDNDFSWRWAETYEDILVAQESETLGAMDTKPAETNDVLVVKWPGFRGKNRDGVVREVSIETDWDTHTPQELWRRGVGPGWSSFAVAGELIYTQEQRGEEELVSCYQLSDGEPVWRHADAARFWESNAGAGPRGTPALHEGRVYTFGGTGIINALDALDGSVIWTRNPAEDLMIEVPEWAFSSSPLVMDDLLLVAVDGTLAAFDRETGDPRWHGPKDENSYSSPHLVEIAGMPQVLLMSGKGATSFDPQNGRVLWQHEWGGFAIVQPAEIGEGQFLISTGDRHGVRRISAGAFGKDWDVFEQWSSIRLKPYFNDFVIHEGHAYGFDNGIFACMNIEDGSRAWKGGRYGRGQAILLADQGLLVILSERGDVVLVAADPTDHNELARMPAVEGKTWNHPALVDDILLVRNDREMAAFRVPVKGP